MSKVGLGAVALAALSLVACGDDLSRDVSSAQLHVVVTTVNGGELPASNAPLPANRGNKKELWGFAIEARDGSGTLDPTFQGVVRLSTRPGAISKVMGEAAVGRNIRLKDGKAVGVVELTAVYGGARLWVEDLGYVPAKPGKKPLCSNGKDDDGDILLDFPADPGCAFADDDTEEGGTYAAGVSQEVRYSLPKISDVQGNGPATPYPYEGIEIKADSPQRLIVTRVASDGFYVTDVSEAEQKNGYNHIFAFNFSTPAGMRVCDHVTLLSGTVNEFFGFTELSFPSYQLDIPPLGTMTTCEVPEPNVIDITTLKDPVAMEKIESSLVRATGYHVASNFGPKLAHNNVFAPDTSNCDFNEDGQINYDPGNAEGSCSNVCAADPECSEFTSFSARGSYKISKGPSDMIQIQTGTVAGFDPLANKGLPLDAVTGTLRNFSGGSLNWTIETRCAKDLACGRPGCVPQALPSAQACVRPRTLDDNDQGTN